MNITFLIGNGFDINLGLRTRYIDFYRDYSSKNANDDTPAIKAFKSEITQYIKDDTHKDDKDIDWRDLEIALGEWTNKLKEEEVEPFYLDLIDSLRNYLVGEFLYFDSEAVEAQKFISYLKNPIEGFFNRDASIELKQYWNNFNGPDQVHIINFNYTPTIERLVKFVREPLGMGVNYGGHASYLYSIQHIHQTLDDEEILVGVNDITQLSNTDFHNNRHICNLLVKPKTNALLGMGTDRDCENLIASTNLFVVYGTSAGITDRKWWKSICNRIKVGGAKLLYFVYGQQGRHMRLRHDVMSEKAIKEFLESAGIKEDEATFASIYSNSYVCFKSGMFALPATYSFIPDTMTYKVGKIDVDIKVLDRSMRFLTLSVDAANEESGVSAIHQWIGEFFPKHTISMQDKQSYIENDVEILIDRIHITSPDCVKDIYFEISSFYGKSNALTNRNSPERRAILLVELVRQSYYD